MNEDGGGLTLPLKKAILGIYIVARAGYTINTATVYPQIEAGTVATEYEPYGTVVIPNADGVASVPSVYPSTMIRTDVNGVLLDAEYHRDINKAIPKNNFDDLLTIEGEEWED